MKIQEAYNQAYIKLMQKGSNTVSSAKFKEGVYSGWVTFKKRAMWASVPTVTYRIYKKGWPYLINKEEKLNFLLSKGVRIKGPVSPREECVKLLKESNELKVKLLQEAKEKNKMKKYPFYHIDAIGY